MKVVTRQVFYCEHCKRHRLTRQAIEKHEPRCIYNPDRSGCGWHGDQGVRAPRQFVERFKANPDVDWLRSEMDGCPACMLAVVVQCGLSSGDREDTGFDYGAEVERFRNEERRSDW